MSKHHIVPKTARFYFSPWLAPSLKSPDCSRGLSLLILGQSQTWCHPFAHPFYHTANEFRARGTPFCLTVIFLSCLVQTEVCTQHLCVNWYCLSSCMFGVASVLLNTVKDNYIERELGLVHFSVLVRWVLSLQVWFPGVSFVFLLSTSWCV